MHQMAALVSTSGLSVPEQVLTPSISSHAAWRRNCTPMGMNAGALWNFLALSTTCLQGAGPWGPGGSDLCQVKALGQAVN